MNNRTYTCRQHQAVYTSLWRSVRHLLTTGHNPQFLWKNPDEMEAYYRERIGQGEDK